MTKHVLDPRGDRDSLWIPAPCVILNMASWKIPELNGGFMKGKSWINARNGGFKLGKSLINDSFSSKPCLITISPWKIGRLEGRGDTSAARFFNAECPLLRNSPNKVAAASMVPASPYLVDHPTNRVGRLYPQL